MTSNYCINIVIRTTILCPGRHVSGQTVAAILFFLIKTVAAILLKEHLGKLADEVKIQVSETNYIRSNSSILKS